MANGKNIEIKIAATGGDQAAAEINKTSEAVEKIASAQKAQAVGEFAEVVGKVSERFREAAGEVGVFDKEAAQALKNTAQNLDAVANSVSAVAQGFAVGGPAGAATASLIVLIGALTDAYQESEIAALKSAQNQREALDAVADATRASLEGAAERERVLSSGEIEAAIRRENEALKAGTEELKNQVGLAREKRDLANELLDAEDRRKTAEIDAKEASGNITREEAAKQRDEVNAGATTRRRDERKNRANEDAALAGVDAVTKSEAANQAIQKAKEAAARETAADKDLTGKLQVASDGTSGKHSFFTSNPAYQKAYSAYEKTRGSGSDSEIDKAGKDLDALKTELVRQAVSDAKIALEKLQGARTEAGADASQASKLSGEAEAARADAQSKAGRAGRVASTVDQLESTDAKTSAIRDGQRRGQADRKKAEQLAEEKRKAENEEEKRRQDTLSKSRGALGIAGDIKKAGGNASQLEARANAALKNPSKGNQAGLEKLLEGILSHLEERENAGKSTPEISKFQHRLERLEGQFKNSRNGR